MTELSREEVQMPLAAQLRAHSNCKASVAWEGQARMLMAWAADTIDAANAAIYEAGAKSERAVSDRLLDALKESRSALEAANAWPEDGGVIVDTIWYTATETLFDYMDAAIAEVEAMRKEQK